MCKMCRKSLPRILIENTLLLLQSTVLIVSNRKDQEALLLFCDEGDFRIVFDIYLQKNVNFEILFKCFEVFTQLSLLNIALEVYPKILMEESLKQTQVFGGNAVDAALNGTNYACSLKGYLILVNAIEKIKWEVFLKHLVKKPRRK